MVLVAAACAVVVIASLLVPEGEVVTLNVLDAKGRSHPTQLWIVELDGRSYLRAAAPDNGWLERLRSEPRAILSRAGEEHPVTAKVLPEGLVRERVNRAMAEKYGASDRLYSALFDRSRSVPVQLEPRVVDAATASRSGAHAGP